MPFSRIIGTSARRFFKIDGCIFFDGIRPEGKLFFTMGRLTSEKVIKIVRMEIPMLISRSGSTALGVGPACQANLTLIGWAKANRFTALSRIERVIFDSNPVIDEAGQAPA
jgi:FdhD protein